LLTKYLFHRRVRADRSQSNRVIEANVDFSYSQDAERFRKELRTWLAAHLTDEVIDASPRRGRDDAAFETLRTWDATMADAGWAALSWPREYGGRGAGPLAQLVFAGETTRARVPLPLNTIGINNIAPAIMQYGSEEQKSLLLPRMLRGIGFTDEHNAHRYLRRLLDFSRYLGTAGEYLQAVGTHLTGAPT
jgi:alkylation response protein AidB-like acyl-CoA dehydrogenase